MATSKGGYVSGGFAILKAPNAPTITSVATNIGSATVAFTAPTDVGGGAITSYTITAVDEIVRWIRRRRLDSRGRSQDEDRVPAAA